MSGLRKMCSCLWCSQYILSSLPTGNSYFMYDFISCKTCSKSFLWTYTLFQKMHFYCMISFLSPYFFPLLSYTSSDFNLVSVCLYTITAMHDLITYVERHGLLICEASFLKHKTHNCLLSLFISCFFLSLSLPTSTSYFQKHLCAACEWFLYSGIKLWKFNCFCVTKSYASLLSFTLQTCVFLIFTLCLPHISFEFLQVLPSAAKFHFCFVCDISQSKILLYSRSYWSHHKNSPCMASWNPLLHIVWKILCISS